MFISIDTHNSHYIASMNVIEGSIIGSVVVDVVVVKKQSPSDGFSSSVGMVLNVSIKEVLLQTFFSILLVLFRIDPLKICQVCFFLFFSCFPMRYRDKNEKDARMGRRKLFSFLLQIFNNSERVCALIHVLNLTQIHVM